MNRKIKLFGILLSAFLLLFPSCVGETKEEKTRRRVENVYDQFQHSLASGTLSSLSEGEMLISPLDEKLLQEAAREYPRGGKNGFYFDTVKFSSEGDLMFINTEDLDTVGHPWGIVQEHTGQWSLYDGEYVFPIVSQESSIAGRLGGPVSIPSEWKPFAESQVRVSDGSVLSTFYFIGTDMDDMVRYLDGAVGDRAERSEDPVLGDVSYVFTDSSGEAVYEMLVWQEIPGLPVLDTADYRSVK